MVDDEPRHRHDSNPDPRRRRSAAAAIRKPALGRAPLTSAWGAAAAAANPSQRRYGRPTPFLALLAIALLALPSLAAAQRRAPLCVATEVRRLVSAPHPTRSAVDRAVAVPLRTPRDGVAFVMASRGLGAAPGITVLRVGRDLSRVGEAVFVPDPAAVTDAPPGLAVGVSVDAGALILQRVAGDLYATVVPSSGAVPAPTRVAASPSPTRDGRGGFAWLTAVARDAGDAHGAIALAGTDDGIVVALRFDGNGRLSGENLQWGPRVGGAMRLLPSLEGTSPSALLERPVRGTTTSGEQAREQVLVRLSDTLEPVGEPARLGLGPDLTAVSVQGRRLVVTQWAESRGLALAALTPNGNTLQPEAPRVWTTQPFEGAPVGHALTEGTHGELYDLALNVDDVGGATHAYLTYIPPAGTPFPRRDVIPTRGRVIAAPALVPADDGVVAVLASDDEVGAGLDAVHLRCELVSLPER